MNRLVLPSNRTLILALFCWGLVWPATTRSGETPPLTLNQMVQTALEVSTALQSRAAEVRQRHAEKAASRSAFFPTLRTSYGYERESHATYVYRTLTDPDSDFTWVIAFEQPVYDPNRLTDPLKLADLELHRAEVGYDVETREIVFKVLAAYFNLLKTREQLKIAREQVHQIEVHEQKAHAFHEAGKIPLNELLQARVRLANARQGATVAENRMKLAEASVNLLLKRPLGKGLRVEKWTEIPFQAPCLSDCQTIAAKNRRELRLAETEIGKARTRLQMARHAYHPTLDLEGFYYRKGTEAYLEDHSDMNHPDGWQLNAVLKWTIWSGNRRPHQVAAEQARVARSRLGREGLADTIGYEVREAYLFLSEAHRNIAVMKEALAQAEENLHLNRGRFDQQLATTTDVLDAQGLLTVTRGRHANALYDEQIARASLKHAMGLDILMPMPPGISEQNPDNPPHAEGGQHEKSSIR